MPVPSPFTVQLRRRLCTHRVAGIVGITIATMAAAACGDGTAPASHEPTTFDMAAVPDTVAVGDSVRLAPLLTLKDASGRLVTSVPVTWETTDSSVLVVEDGDRLVAVDSGVATVRATVPVPQGTISGNTRVAVRRLVRDIALRTRADSFVVGDTMRVEPIVADGRGHAMPASRVVLSSSDTMVLRIDPLSNIARAVGDGTATVVADGDGTHRELPLKVQLVRLALGDIAVARLAIGDSHACAVDTAGAAFCWGAAGLGQAGYGGSSGTAVPPSRVAGGLMWADIDVQDETSCGVTTASTAWCWGEFAHGTAPHLSPAEVPLPSTARPAAQVRIGRSDALCVIGTSGDSGCWGNNNSLLLAREPAATRDMTVLPLSGSLQWRAIDPGFDHSCGVTTAGSLECWGILGKVLPGAQTSSTPVAVAPTLRFTAVASGVDFTCALDEQGVARCFGANDMGQLGRGTTTTGISPQAMQPVSGDARFTRIYAGDRYACALTADGTAWCWGERARGTGRSLVPIVFSREFTFASFAAGTRGACGVTADGSVRCAPIVVAAPPP